MLAILKKQAEFADNMVKCMETKKRSEDLRDEELARMLFGLGGVKDSQANYSKAEQLRIEHKPEVVSRVLSGGGIKKMIVSTTGKKKSRHGKNLDRLIALICQVQFSDKDTDSTL